jgi:glycerol-3-phosphate acyltransferase PlsY
MTLFIFFLGAYLLGSFPSGVFISRKKYGLDVREVGSGNIGATNVQRIFGWYAGALTFLADFAKGAIPLFVFKKFYPEDPWLVSFLGTALVIGHCFSIFLGFKGGKGVATSLGCIFSTVPSCALLFGAVYLITLKVSRISALGSLAGVIFSIGYLLISWPGAPLGSMVLTLCAIIVFRHRENFLRLKKTWVEKKTKH